MYNIAQVTAEKCVAKKGCRLCIMYCPEANCLDLDVENQIAMVIMDRCKGCELCKVGCDAAKHEAIDMVAVSADGSVMDKAGEAAELGQAYQG